MNNKAFPPAPKSIEPRASGQQGKTPVSHAGGAGSVTREAHQLEPIELARFWSRVDVSTDFQCWPWKGRKNQRGYGRIDGGMAHRMAYTLVNGDIPDGMIVRHTCDNPPCCNPKHLLVGTDADNARDSIERNRKPIGEGHARSKLTEDAVRYIRSNPDRLTLYELAERFNAAKATISYVRSGKTWKHV